MQPTKNNFYLRPRLVQEEKQNKSKKIRHFNEIIKINKYIYNRRKRLNRRKEYKDTQWCSLWARQWWAGRRRIPWINRSQSMQRAAHSWFGVYLHSASAHTRLLFSLFEMLNLINKLTPNTRTFQKPAQGPIAATKSGTKRVCVCVNKQVGAHRSI